VLQSTGKWEVDWTVDWTVEHRLETSMLDTTGNPPANFRAAKRRSTEPISMTEPPSLLGPPLQTSLMALKILIFDLGYLPKPILKFLILLVTNPSRILKMPGIRDACGGGYEPPTLHNILFSLSTPQRITA
jgi:hypothetical protein